MGGFGLSRGRAQGALPAGHLLLAVGADPHRPGEGRRDDDRVWLGRANLAIKTGRFDEAARWLDACSERRPDDLTVWCARLDLARATSDWEGAWRALDHLPADGVSPVESLRLRAWLAARLGDAAVERAALAAVLEQEPGDTAALDRLAELSAEAGAVRGGDPDPVGGGPDRRRQGVLPGPDRERLDRRPRGARPPGRNLGPPDRGPRLGPDPGRKGITPGSIAAEPHPRWRRGGPGPGPDPRRALRRPPARRGSPPNPRQLLVRPRLSSSTTPRPAASASSTRTAGPRSASSPRR